jgi:hypothetical protein
MKPSYSYRTNQGTFRIVPIGHKYLLSVHEDNGLGRDLELYSDPGAACVSVAERTTGFEPWDTSPTVPENVGKLGYWQATPLPD